MHASLNVSFESIAAEEKVFWSIVPGIPSVLSANSNGNTAGNLCLTGVCDRPRDALWPLYET